MMTFAQVFGTTNRDRTSLNTLVMLAVILVIVIGTVRLDW